VIWPCAGASFGWIVLIVHDRELARAYDAEWQRLWATVPEERVCNAFEVYLPMVVRDYISS
jgi:hypothetical protein